MSIFWPAAPRGGYFVEGSGGDDDAIVIDGVSRFPFRRHARKAKPKTISLTKGQSHSLI